MARYHVIRKSDNTKVYAYEASAPIEWADMEFALFDHIPVGVAEVTPTTMYGGRRQLTKLEFRRLFTPEELGAVDEFNACYTSIELPAPTVKLIRSGLEDFSVAQEVNLDDPSVGAMLGLYSAFGLLTAERISGVMRG
jgi:hypothetical protein